MSDQPKLIEKEDRQPGWPKSCLQSWLHTLTRWKGDDKSLSPATIDAIRHTMECNLLYVNELEGERDELQASFDMRYAATMRAIKQWQSENPRERLLTWPDHADLLTWMIAIYDRSGFDLCPCGNCGETVLSIGEGAAYCKNCIEKVGA